jgi:hypothetical protein
MDWIYLGQDRDNLQALVKLQVALTVKKCGLFNLVKEVMNIRVPKHAGNFLSG